MRKALVVGIDYYKNVKCLSGCVNDAYSVKSVLERNGDGSPNFGINMLLANAENSIVLRKTLKEKIRELFEDDSEIALFYFSGHGYIESTGGFLITSESKEGDDGFPMDELTKIVNFSKAKNKVIILDCCYSGAISISNSDGNQTILNEGVTILTASTNEQYSNETNGSGIFTSLFVDALSGGAANLIGNITPGSVYAHIDQALGPWEQRPIFRTNVKKFISLRNVQPAIELDDLRKIIELFPDPTHVFDLDPSYEPTSSTALKKHSEKFSILQNYCHVNIVKPIEEEHMYYAAINSKACKLTALGVHYWNLVKKGRI